jgi:hypothetical protein
MQTKTSDVESFWINDSLECYQKNNLVYVRILKNASTFYTNLFVSSGWELIEFKNINWSTNQVFGFIQDPVRRYLKGLTEDLYNDFELQKHIFFMIQHHKNKNILPLTLHTMPISLTCGDYMYDMLWIPIDIDNSSIQVVKNLCNEHNISLTNDINSTNMHNSNSEKLELYKKIKIIFGNGHSNFWKLLSKDIELYYQTITK